VHRVEAKAGAAHAGIDFEMEGELPTDIGGCDGEPPNRVQIGEAERDAGVGGTPVLEGRSGGEGEDAAVVAEGPEALTFGDGGDAESPGLAGGREATQSVDYGLHTEPVGLGL